jgi:hypothetical protein
VRAGSPIEYSFQDWESPNPLPLFDDDVTGFPLTSPPGNLFEVPVQVPELPVHIPHHSAFGEPSSIVVPIPPLVAQLGMEIDSEGSIGNHSPHATSDTVANHDRDFSVSDVGSPSPLRRKSQRKVRFPAAAVPPVETKRKPVNQRWFYETVVDPPQLTLLTICDGVSSDPKCVASTDIKGLMAREEAPYCQFHDYVVGGPKPAPVALVNAEWKCQNLATKEKKESACLVKADATTADPGGPFEAYTLAAIHVHNHTPSAALMGMSPYEVVYGPAFITPPIGGEGTGEPSEVSMHSGVTSNDAVGDQLGSSQSPAGSSTGFVSVGQDTLGASFSHDDNLPSGGGPPDQIMALSSRQPRKRFTIRLQFPNGEFRDQTYSVSRDLLVSDFKVRMSNLMRTSSSVVLSLPPRCTSSSVVLSLPPR